jgi:hypothetical protein
MIPIQSKGRSRRTFALPAHRSDRLRILIHAEIPSLAVLFYPNQGTCLRTTANRSVAFVPAVKKSWGGQKIAHVSYGYDASLSAVDYVE